MRDQTTIECKFISIEDIVLKKFIPMSKSFNAAKSWQMAIGMVTVKTR